VQGQKATDYILSTADLEPLCTMIYKPFS